MVSGEPRVTDVVRGCYSDGSAINAGEHRLGGLVGSNNGTVANSCSFVTVNGHNASGGLVGNNDGTIDSCYAIGSVTGIGQYLEGYPSVGGLVGVNEEGVVVSNSFWDIEESGID